MMRDRGRVNLNSKHDRLLDNPRLDKSPSNIFSLSLSAALPVGWAPLPSFEQTLIFER